MITYDSLCQLMTTFDNFWQLLTTFENLWKRLRTFDNLYLYTLQTEQLPRLRRRACYKRQTPLQALSACPTFYCWLEDIVLKDKRMGDKAGGHVTRTLLEIVKILNNLSSSVVSDPHNPGRLLSGLRSVLSRIIWTIQLFKSPDHMVVFGIRIWSFFKNRIYNPPRAWKVDIQIFSYRLAKPSKPIFFP